MHPTRITMMLSFWFSPSLLHAALVSRCIDRSFSWPNSSFSFLIYLLFHSKYRHFCRLQCLHFLEIELSMHTVFCCCCCCCFCCRVCTLSNAFDFENICYLCVWIYWVKYEQTRLKPHKNRAWRIRKSATLKLSAREKCKAMHYA